MTTPDRKIAPAGEDPCFAADLSLEADYVTDEVTPDQSIQGSPRTAGQTAVTNAEEAMVGWLSGPAARPGPSTKADTRRVRSPAYQAFLRGRARPAVPLIAEFIRCHADRREAGGLRWGVEPICKVLTEHLGLRIAPSTYYEHAARPVQTRAAAVRDASLLEQIRRGSGGTSAAGSSMPGPAAPSKDEPTGDDPPERAVLRP